MFNLPLGYIFIDLRFDGQVDIEGGAFSIDTCAFSPQTSAVHFDQAAADGQAQAGAACFACGGGIHLCEFLEDRFEHGQLECQCLCLLR